MPDDKPTRTATAPGARKKKPTKPSVPVSIDTRAMPKLLADAVVFASKLDQPGKKKKEAAVKEFAASLDRSLEGGRGPFGKMVEKVDGPAFELFASFVQGAYNQLRRRGRV